MYYELVRLKNIRYMKYIHEVKWLNREHRVHQLVIVLYILNELNRKYIKSLI